MKKRVLKIRYKEGNEFGSKLMLKGNSRKVGNQGGKRILSMRKISNEEILSASTPGGVGEFFRGDKLMEELRQIRESQLQEVRANG